jgi:Na+/melibiose symporter-like transporter
MRCYKGKCRLADNPEDAVCSIATSSSESASSSSASAIIKTITPTPTAKGNNSQSVLGGFFANFSWQWLAFAGVILIIAIALIIISIANAKKDPWQANDKTKYEKPGIVNRSNNFEKTQTSIPTETANQEKGVEIPESKPLQF